MLKLSLSLSFLFWAICLFGQNPHGKDFKADCSLCHTSAGWKVDIKSISFDHDSTRYKLVGQHKGVGCRSCHKSLEFDNIKSDCASCHHDLHENTLGPDCSRCHTPKSWIIEDISGIHRESRFPLTGAHQIGDCSACHKSGSFRRFEPIGIECINCHRNNYLATTKPKHQEAGYSTNCIECHKATSGGWLGGNIEHNFFPLTDGHAISCTDCHKSGDYAKIPTDCYSCHKSDFSSTTTPDHEQINLSTNCQDCHTTKPTWKPAKFGEHDSRFFPIYSGKHANSWASCADCHKQASVYNVFSCIDCHEHAKAAMEEKHKAANGFQYNSTSCFTCHPRGDRVSGFNHGATNFPLTGAHKDTDCVACHAFGFAGTAYDCNSCHNAKYKEAQAPVHTTAGIPTLCEPCHSTTAWKPSTFTHVSTGYDLIGGHLKVQQCVDCHKGTLVNTKTECIACHQVQYDMAKEHKSKSYPVDCNLCHNANSWKEVTFDHALSKFPLTGAHVGTECAGCHANGYVGISTDCSSCHTPVYTSSQNPNHAAAGLPKSCETCHSTNAWKPSGFNHTSTGYELTGGHLRVAQCSDCHKGTVLNTKTECIACHQVQYDQARNHKSQLYPVECKLCHNINTWDNASFDHSKSNFPLTGAHKTAVCEKCHTKGYSGTPSDCNSCHTTSYTTSLNPNHVAAGLPAACETCHSTTAWKPSGFNHNSTGYELTGGHSRISQCSECHKGTVLNTKTDCIACHQVDYNNAKDHKSQSYPVDCKVCHNINNWDNASFNHSLTSFPLTGAHTSTLCAKCHTSGYSGTPTDCNSCHTPVYNTAQNPNHAAAGIPRLCETCHNTTAWKPSAFDHNITGFALTGGHSRVLQCSDCHKGTVLNTKTDCIACHQVQYDNAKDHKVQAYPVDCKLCHNMNNWDNAAFNHSLTSFPLTGAHTSTLCAKCHISGYSGTPNDCNSCHGTSFTSALNPNHVAAGIPRLCESCHNTTAWKPSTFSHITTGFALTGGHSRVLQCSACHKGTVLNTKKDCIACHQVQYDNAKDHKSQAYPTDCKLCHNINNWDNASFNHSLTSFPLTGAHSATLCAKCHTSGFAGTPTDCNSCHSPSFNSAQIPNHITAGLPKLCETCHNTTAWKPSIFDHTSTGFILSGGHSKIVQCSDCHKGTVLNTKTECIECHQVQYDNAKDHKAQAYPVDCKLCHNINNWDNASFNHSLTNFPLTGAHTTTLCAKCHVSGYTGTKSDCNSCHTASFVSSQNPNHIAAGIPRLCETCHNTTAWKPSTFNHTATGFALTGGHALVPQCSQCHKGTLLNANTECIACHQVQYDTAKDHKSQSYPQDCKMCHNSNNWLNASFNHSQTSFPLTGVHATTLCAKCHVNGYAGTKTDCNACHAAAYLASQSPNHVSAGIPVLCETCHTATAWKPSSFNHTTTGFPLTGGHAVIPQCAQCHKGTVLNTKTDCIACHQVQYDTAKDHKAQSYPQDCKMCHNPNNWLNASFNHSQTSFPLTGVHSTTLCSKCHASGYNNTPTACVSCHQTNYNSAVNPNHKSLGLSTNCGDCHTTNAGWEPATFAVHSTYYVLSGAHSAVAPNCALCHKGNYTTTPNTCYGCHSAQYIATTNPNHATAQFPKECESCHTVAAWKPSTFSHDNQYFPIYSGKHKGKWTLCSECHTTATNWLLFSCIDCHEHNKTSMDNEHKGKKDYLYNSVACYTCHPRGSG